MSSTTDIEPFRDEAFVSLYIMSPELTTHQLAGAIGIAPDIQQAGRPGHVDDNHLVDYKSGLPRLADFAAHLRALVARLEPARSRIGDLVRDGSVFAVLHITGEVADCGVELELPPEHLAFMANLGLKLSFRVSYHNGVDYYRERARLDREERLRRLAD